MLRNAALLALQLVCGTSPDMTERVQELGAWSAARARTMASKGVLAASAVRRDNVFLLPADETNAPFRRPFDLAGRTLQFTRAGSTGFSVANVPLAYNNDTGSTVSWSGTTASVDLGFHFPFFGTTIRNVVVSQMNAIFVETGAVQDIRQFGDVEIGTLRRRVIAPLLTTDDSSFGSPPILWIRKTSEAVTFTWRSSGNRLDIQAVLSRSGNIAFSYKAVTVQAVGAGAVLITSGTEPWREDRTPIVAAGDSDNDLAVTLPPELAPMYDIVNAGVSSVAGTDMLEFRIDLRGTIDRSVIPAGQPILFNVGLGPPGAQQFVRFYLYGTGSDDYYSLPGWGGISGSTGARVEGSSIFLTIMQEHLAGVTSPEVRISTVRGTRFADSAATLTLPAAAPARTLRTDFSALTTATLDNVPISEAFTLPILSPQRVWQQLKESDPALADADIDAVAIYQNFYTDIITFAGAYATVGNSGAAGISYGDDPSMTAPRTPNLMHMNTLGYGHNSTPPGASRVVLHEFGHRWLLFVSLLENGLRGKILNPAGAHPAQYIDTRAAFKVYTDRDTSVMGGGYFTENSNGTFTTAQYAPYGYSWLDLYLMGLAAPSEVPPWFYVADSSPALGNEYYAPANQTYSGTRREVTMQQVIDGTGPRKPAYPDAQQRFRVVFVLVTEPEREPAPSELAAIQGYRATLEADFVTATNHRGAVTTVPPVENPHRRAVRR
jgi:hypothetical protein